MDAAMHGHAEVIKLLLEAGATAIKTKEVSEGPQTTMSDIQMLLLYTVTMT